MSQATRLSIATLFACAALPSVAVAQPAREEPRALYEEGRVLARSGDYDEAARRFSAAYLVQPSPLYLQSYAMARQAVNRLGEAARAHRRLLRDHLDAPRDVVERSRRQLEALRAELDLVQVTIDSPTGDDGLLLDGTRVTVHTDGTVMVSPGRHIFALRRGDGVVATSAIDAVAGGASRVTLTPPTSTAEADSMADAELRTEEPSVPISAIDTGAAPPARGPEVWESPWLWIGVGLLVVIGVGIAVGVAVSGEQAYEGSLTPGHLRF